MRHFVSTFRASLVALASRRGRRSRPCCSIRLTRTPSRPRLVVCFLFIGCTHEAPYILGAYAPGVPPGTGPLVRLTYNPGVDLSPSWLPDGTGFFYTNERIDRADLDRCLALLPAAGGTITRQICERAPAAADSVNAFSSAAVAPDGRLAYVRATAPLLEFGWPVAPYFQQLVLATLAAPTIIRVLLPIPYQGPSGRRHLFLSQIHWLGDSTLVYLAEHAEYVGCGRECLDTLRSGLEIVRLEFSGPVPVLSMLPGSDQASSLAVVGDTVFFTVNGDSRVFRLALANDSASVEHDFGAGGIARDVQVWSDRLVAVVGGDVSIIDMPPTGPIQRDGGGTILLVDRVTGAETPLTAVNQFFRHPALSPVGTRLVAEAVTGRTTDLWLLEVP